MLHRNSQKRIYFDDAVYFITIVTQNRTKFFSEEIFCDLFVEELRLREQLKDFKLYGFIIIPNHIHLLIHPGEKYNISKIIKSLKENTSRDINRIIYGTGSEGDTSTWRLRIRELIRNSRVEFTRKYGNNPKTFPKFQWQKSFHDHYIRDDNDFDYHLEYILTNPEKHKIIDDYAKYKYSSYNNHRDLIDSPN